LFPIRKRGIFRPGKEIKGLRGGVPLYAAQVILMIDTARAEKNRFRMETIDAPFSERGCSHLTHLKENV
jgi:hypothetical protein